ncbi:glycosyltransferase family 4 protein [Kytococcus sedentarius]|uniref:glycosyltransferase family 4 protein n=1 Tax=Kytococcus sedentarius TaxID=1276 RepID=UPI0035BC8D35
MTRHIGLVCPFPVDVPGGVQAHVRDLAGTLQAEGHRVSVLAPVSGTGAALRRAARADAEAPLEPLAAAAWGLPKTVGLTVVPGALRVPYAGSASHVTSGQASRAAVSRWLRTTAPTLLHLHEPMAPSLSLTAADVVADRLPLVATFHNSFAPGHTVRQVVPLVRRVLAPVRASVAVSRTTRDSVRECLGTDPWVIPTGVRIHRFTDPAPRAPWAEGPGRPTLAFIGRSSEHRKGLSLLLRAVPDIVRRTPGARIFVAGPGQPEARSAVEREFPELRTSIVWLGELSEADKASLMRSVTAVVAPQVQGENFGITLVEAMAAGAPVVASDLPAYVSVLQGAGRHFRAGDAADLARVLEDVVLDPPLRERMRAAGRTRAGRFDWQVVGQEVMGVYDEVEGR